MAEENEEWTEIPIENQEHVDPEKSMEDIIEVIDEDAENKASGEPEPEPEPVSGKDEDSRYKRRIGQLTAKHREEERRRQDIETENRELRGRLEKLEQGVDQQQIANFKSEYDRVLIELEEATEEGDTKRQVALTEKIADMRAAARVADQQRSVAQPQYQQQETQPVQQEAPPQEAMKWWNQNRWFNSPDHSVESAAARAVDAQLDSEGWDKESADYYTELDNRLQKRFPELYSSPKKSKAPIAPARGNNGASGSKQPKDGRMRFTKAQLDMAKSLGITDEAGLREYHAEIQKGAV